MSKYPASPTCVGFIMDGNRRWAKQHSLDTVAGHHEGMRRFEEVITWVRECGIPHVVFYAFSTENWKRSESEVTALLSLFAEALRKTISARVRFIGERTRFPQTLQDQMAAVEAQTVDTNVTVWIALSYGGRAEIIAAAEQLRQLDKEITETSLAGAMWSAGMPDPDLIIRTGGDMRLSNFLPWQSIYSELMFTDSYWPAFTKEEFTRMLAQYGERKRRFGA